MVPSVFSTHVAQKGAKDVPFIGFIARSMKCVFVDNSGQSKAAAQTPRQQVTTQQAEPGIAAKLSTVFSSAASGIAKAILPAVPATPAQPASSATGTPSRPPRSGTRSSSRSRRQRGQARSGSASIQAHQTSLANASATLAASNIKTANASDSSALWSKLHALVWPLLCDWGLVAEDDVVPPLCIFAEGTTTNGTDLIQFRTGAFLQNQPVQPVVLTYHWRHASPSWETVPNHQYAMRMLSQLGHAVTITYLPIVEPVETITGLVPEMLLSSDPEVRSGGSCVGDPASFAAVVRTRMREYIALRHAYESNSAMLPPHYASALASVPPRMLLPAPGPGVPLPAMLVDGLRRVCFGSGYLWFQPFWASHAVQPFEKWALHDRIRSGEVHWQWWRQPYTLPRVNLAGTLGLQTVPAVGGATSIVCFVLDAILPSSSTSAKWLAQAVYASAKAAALLSGDAVMYPGWESTPADAGFAFIPPNSQTSEERVTPTRLNFHVESSVHSPVGALVAAFHKPEGLAEPVPVPVAATNTPKKHSASTSSSEDPSSSQKVAQGAGAPGAARSPTSVRQRIKRVPQAAVSSTDSDSDSTLPPSARVIRAAAKRTAGSRKRS